MSKDDDLKDRLDELFSSTRTDGGTDLRTTSISEAARLESPLAAISGESIFDTFTEAVFITDVDGNIIYINSAFEQIYGYSRDEAIGENPKIIKSGLIPFDGYHDFRSELLNKQVVTGEMVNKSKDGRLIQIEGSNSPILDNNGEIVAFLAVHRDITERKRAEENSLKQATELATVFEVSAAAATVMQPEELLQLVVELTKERFNLYHTHIYLLNENKDALILASGAGEPGRKMVAQGWKISFDSVRSLVARAARNHKGVIVNNVQLDPDFLPNELLPDTAAELAVPLIVGKNLLGVLDVQSDQVDYFTEKDVNTYSTLAFQVAIALQNARQYEHTQQGLNALEVINKAMMVINQTTDLDEILGGMLEQAIIQSNYDAGLISFFDPQLERLILVEHQGLPEVMYNRLIEHGFDNTPCDLVYQLKKIVYVQDIYDLPDDLKEKAFVFNGPKKFGFKSYFGIPFISQGGVFGTMCLFNYSKVGISDFQKDVLQAISQQINISYDRAMQYERTQATLAGTQALYTGSAQVIAAESAEDVLLALVENTELRQLDRASIAYFDQPWEEAPPDSAMTVAAWQRSGDQPLSPAGSSFPVRGNPFFSTIQPGQASILFDVRTDERLDQVARDAMTATGMRGGLVMPLVAGEVWFGILTGQSLSPLKLSEEDVRRINTLVDQAAAVIQGLRLQDEMRERVSELTTLQRMMSREAWASYQAQAGGESLGYLFDKVQVKPLSHELVSRNVEGGNGRSSEVDVLADALKDVFSTTLAVRGEPIGVLGVQQESGYVLTQSDEDFLLAVSEQVAQAMERARLIEQTQKAAVELQAVADVSTATSTILNPEELLQSVVDLTKRNFGLYHAHVYLLDDNGKSLNLVVGAGEIGRGMALEGWSIFLDEQYSLVASVARTRKGQVITDVRQYEGYMPNPLLPHTLSELAVPMIVGDTLLGVFDVQSDVVGRFTEDEDVSVYGTLASQVAVALQNANLYEEQLNTVERLRELDNMKSAFLANMSHELRTPLNSILGFTQVIREGLDGPLTDMMVSDLELIEKNGKHLLNLINDVLDMAKIEAGRLTLSPEPLSLYELLEDVIISNGLLAKDKNLYLNLVADPDADWTVMADHVRMRQIFINLIGNSIKFTDRGGITVELEKLLANNELEKDRIQVRVCDTGVGVPPERLEDIFEAFSQVDSTTTRKAGGTGLGLPISRRLVELHGGKLWADSKGIPGQGSVLYLELPIGN
jgi:PAS domain S-box-containing protein